MKKKRKCSALTFIEMLLATAMVSVIAVALYGMISNGLKVWQIVNQESPQINSNIFFEKINMELKNAIGFEGIDFVGDESSFSFGCVARTAESDNGFNQGIGRVKYFYDQGLNSFYRQYADYEQLLSLEQPQARSLLENVNNVSLSYYFYDDQKETFLWNNTWPPESLAKLNKRALPLAVRVAIVFTTEETISKRIKTMDIPIGAIEY
ncbi:MAG: type II secretion system protein GspJ [Candidatus Omnitrophota bacterium]